MSCCLDFLERGKGERNIKLGRGGREELGRTGKGKEYNQNTMYENILKKKYTQRNKRTPKTQRSRKTADRRGKEEGGIGEGGKGKRASGSKHDPKKYVSENVIKPVIH